jgi:hypothetical protein
MTSQYDQLIKTIEGHPLSKSLPKILRVTQDLKDSELEKWIRLELHGYWDTNPALTNEVVVPEYRTVAGYYTDDYGRQLVISDPKLGYINEMRLRFGVTELEGMIGAKGPLAFRAPIFAALIQEHLKVEVTTFYFSTTAVSPVLESIRTQFSDHIISRKEKFERGIFKTQKSESEDIIQLKPNIYGIGVDLKALWRKFYKA